ncbi:hypothetical protein LG202_13660 [Methylobacillus methanolivorans]
MNKLHKTSHHYNVKPVTLILGPSCVLAILFALIGLMAAVAIALLPWAWWIKLMAILSISAVTMWHIRRDAWQMHPISPLIIELTRDGKLWLTIRNGTRHAAQVQYSSLVTAKLTVLNLKLEHGKATCLITSDAVDPDEFRRLRVWLRWRREASDEV